MKSDSGSKPQPRKQKPKKQVWRLGRTLKRTVSFRPIEDEDVKYAWAAYKKGGLSVLGGQFSDPGMSAEDFKREFEAFVIANHHGAWTLFAQTKNGNIPVGVVFAAWTFPGAAFMTVNGLCWFPWASNRNILEAILNFLHSIRKEIPLVFYAAGEHKRTYEVCAMHGVVRRIGTSYSVIPGQPAAVFETRAA